ncbi:DUF4276 family protein [Stigmatella sp. ncwal1]|uniref:DUF4276 family protein n=1 Tax=Stigmatella ashevillensis TaxID=2995309 RepID=A0ABT5DHX1_9BACT|nr:DUF4276 family protein [Stigmatella ashevillena]MDC0711961.1 DUF4276 family protein [Stigmatella ashevillena]
MFRVVVYAEGAGELAGSKNFQRAPGAALTEEELGSAHLLVRRCLEKVRDLDASGIRFEEPLRTGRGKLARGSILHSPATLRPLLLWADPARQPDLAVVLVDADGDDARQGLLDSSLQGIPVESVVGVAIQEFETWLLADPNALEEVLRQPVTAPKPPEKLSKRQSKELLHQWCEQHARSRDAADLRRDLARQCDLDTLTRQCTAFAQFLHKLGTRRA